MLSPSAIQRAEDFVGIEIPTGPLSWANAWGASVKRPSVTAAMTDVIALTLSSPFDSRIFNRLFLRYGMADAHGQSLFDPQSNCADSQIRFASWSQQSIIIILLSDPPKFCRYFSINPIGVEWSQLDAVPDCA